MKTITFIRLIIVLYAITSSEILSAKFNNTFDEMSENKIKHVVVNSENQITDVQQLSSELWEQIPGPFGGIVQCQVGYDNVLLAGTMGGGLYSSSDYGDNWFSITGDLPFFDIQKVLYYNGRLFVVNKDYGIYFSDNGGLNWQPTNSGLTNKQVTSLVELDGILFCSTYGSGIFASTDKGNNWFEKNSGLANKFVNQLTLYLGGLYLATNQGIYVSGNSGDNWGTFKASGAYMHIAVNGEYVFIATSYQVSMTSNGGQDWDLSEYGLGLGSGTIYAIYSSGPYIIAGRSSGVYVSTFIGGQWSNVHSKLLTFRVYSLLNFNFTLYAGTSKGVYFSTDWGNRWKESNNGMLNERVLAITMDKEIMYAGLEDNGIIRSSDYGATWEDLNLGYKKVSYIYKEKDDLWVISNDTLMLTSNYGINWEYRNYGLEGNKLNFISKYQNNIYVGTDDGLFFTTNLGISWKSKSWILEHKNIRAMFVPKNDDIYVASADKVYVSRDNGSTWVESSEGMKSYDITSISGNDDYIVAGSAPTTKFDAELYVSYDGARTWKSTDFQYTDKYFHEILVSGPSVFVSVRNLSTAEHQGILYSSNSGKSWNDFNQGLYVKDIRDMFLQNNQIYAATYGASLYKRDIPEPLFAPLLLYPEDNSKNIFTQPALDWEDTDGAEIYNIEISSSLDKFGNFIIAEFSSTISQYNVPENILEYKTKYYWRVNFRKNNRTSDWSEIFNFTTESEQITVTNLLMPANNSIDLSVLTDFEWESLSNANGYIIQVSESDLFDEILLNETVTSNNLKAPKGVLEFSKKYYWRVRAIINDAVRDWSEINNFTTLTLVLQSPTLIYPMDNALDVELSSFFEWDAVGNADEYILFISDDSQFSNTVYIDTLSSTIFNVIQGLLDYDSEYYWKVKAKFLGYESQWSVSRKFTTKKEVSVEDGNFLSKANIQIMPNPANHQLNINVILPFTSQMRINISDLTGRKMITEQFEDINAGISKTIAIPVEKLSSGKYILIIETKFGLITRSFVIQH